MDPLRIFRSFAMSSLSTRSVRRIWIKWDIWPSSEETAGVGRLFQRRGKLGKLVKGCVLRTLAEGPAPRGHARAGDLPYTGLTLTIGVRGLFSGEVVGASHSRTTVCSLRNFCLGSGGPLTIRKPFYRQTVFFKKLCCRHQMRQYFHPGSVPRVPGRPMASRPPPHSSLNSHPIS